MIIRTTHTYFLSTEHVPGIVLDAGDIVVNKLDKNPCPTEELNIQIRKVKGQHSSTY